MSVIRLIHIKVKADQADAAIAVWKKDCAPLMIKQQGCLSEKLLKCEDAPGEYISYSEWESDADIERYRKSADHDKIRKDARDLQGAQAVVKRYSVVG
jgi:heme-degrading monooxygenase HmoA